MTYRLPALQPLWSFVSAAALPHLSPDQGQAWSPPPARPVQGWSPGEDGRPRLRWRVGRTFDA